MLDAAAGVTGTSPIARDDHTMAAVGTDIYLFGGNSDGELFRFSTISMEWTMLDAAAGVTGTSPSARLSHAMTAVRTDIYLFGGYTYAESGKDCIWSMGKGRRRGVCMLVAGYWVVGPRVSGMGARKSYGRKTWWEQPCTTRRVYEEGGKGVFGQGAPQRQVVLATLYYSLQA
jgi:hypothetical protein